MSKPAAVRIDKWLWAARFFKTRALATEAVTGGKVHVNGQRVKPSRSVQVGERLQIHKGTQEFTVVVQGISVQRGPASIAQTLYEETEESRAARERLAEQRRLAAAAAPAPDERPSKRDRRKIIRFIRKQG